MNEVRWQRAPVLWREALGEVTVMAVEGTEPLVLPPPGATVWALLVEPLSFEELVADLSEIHRAEPAAVASDLLPFLQRLAAAGVLRAV